MNLSSIDKTMLLIIVLVFWFSSVMATYSFIERKQTNQLISKCISETKDFVACKSLYARR